MGNGKRARKLQRRKVEREQVGVKKPVKHKKPAKSEPITGVAELYSEPLRTLCVGEGNFSFARAVCRLCSLDGSHVVATSYDCEEVVLQKYEEGSEPVSDILDELRQCGAKIQHNVDATALNKALKAHMRSAKSAKPNLFERVIFNFPHVGMGIKDQAVNIRRNQELLTGFFQSACTVLNNRGEVHVALKDGLPYSQWQIVSLAHHATGGLLTLKTVKHFEPSKLPGYSHRRTLGFVDGESATANEELAKGSKTYSFQLKLPKPSPR